MSHIIDLRMIWVLCLRELIRMTKEPSRLVGIIIQPLMFWAVIGAGFMPSFRVEENLNLNYQDFFFVGVIAMVILFSAIFSTITLIDDKSSGFMQAVLVAPGNKLSLVLGKVLGVSLLACLQAGFLILVGILFGYSIHSANWLLVLEFLFLGSFCLSCLGFYFAWKSPSAAAYHAFMGIVLIPLWILSGAMFPPNTPWMQWVVAVNPVAWLVAGLRAAFAGGIAPVGSVTDLLQVNYCASALILFSLLCIFASVRACRN